VYVGAQSLPWEGELARLRRRENGEEQEGGDVLPSSAPYVPLSSICQLLIHRGSLLPRLNGRRLQRPRSRLAHLRLEELLRRLCIQHINCQSGPFSKSVFVLAISAMGSCAVHLAQGKELKGRKGGPGVLGLTYGCSSTKLEAL
jgi:hypothetical protein